VTFAPAGALHLFDAPRSINSLAVDFIQQYHNKRYLRELTETELDVRLNDVLSNLMVLGEDRKYRPQFHVRADGIYSPVRGLDFLRMAVDVWEEYRLRAPSQRRTHDRSGLALAERLADESWCWRPHWQEVSQLSKDADEQPRMLFRFSSRVDWNRAFLEHGRFYVQPASAYGNSSLDNARRDDELSTTWFDEELERRSYTASDYYCMCFSATYDYRLLADFSAASCVAIHDPPHLWNRVKRAIEKHNANGGDHRIARLSGSPVRYTDPFQLLRPTHDMEVQFVKHFRYAYQAEYRLVLVPSDVRPLRPFFLELGSIADIASVVEKQ
jgi:hypothetical protein